MLMPNTLGLGTVLCSRHLTSESYDSTDVSVTFSNVPQVDVKHSHNVEPRCENAFYLLPAVRQEVFLGNSLGLQKPRNLNKSVYAEMPVRWAFLSCNIRNHDQHSCV